MPRYVALKNCPVLHQFHKHFDTDCGCDLNGSASLQCQNDGTCSCKAGFSGPKCKNGQVSGPSTKLLIITGKGSESTKSEIIDLADPDMKCEPWDDYPLDVYGASGKVVNDNVMICGGRDQKTKKIMDKCYKLGPNSTEAMPNLATPSYGSSSGVLNNSLFITGGYKDSANPLGERMDRTEFISENQQENGVDIPIKSHGHCIIQINPNELILTGGFTDKYVKFFDCQSETTSRTLFQGR